MSWNSCYIYQTTVHAYTKKSSPPYISKLSFILWHIFPTHVSVRFFFPDTVNYSMQTISSSYDGRNQNHQQNKDGPRTTDRRFNSPPRWSIYLSFKLIITHIVQLKLLLLLPLQLRWGIFLLCCLYTLLYIV